LSGKSKYAETYPLLMVPVIVSATVPVQLTQPGSPAGADCVHDQVTWPTVTAAAVGGVGVAALTVKVTGEHEDLPAMSTAQTEKVLAPTTVGVPVRVPFRLSVRPNGGNPTPLPS
jgi:hypothetical protein